MRQADQQVQAQEAEYAFPYHYIPTLLGPKFSSTRHWDWGFRYLGGMQLVLDLLAEMPFQSLVDIGCGDGRFLREVALRYPGAKLLGVDASERAVNLAKALNPGLEYDALDIVQHRTSEQFDVATLIEVIEHIPPLELSRFITAAANRLRLGGRLILTVPHRNKPVIEKHYQHFDSQQLTDFLEPHFTQLRFVPFDRMARRAPLMWIIEHILGTKGKWFLVTNRRLLYLLYRLYLKRYLYCDEQKCERIAVIGMKK